VQFPKDAPKDADGRDSISLIRLITRIMFCWFLKEKGLLPTALFNADKMAELLGTIQPTESTYYKAILQNLFFATLNQEMDKREFRRDGQNFMAHNLYRYRSLMTQPDEVLKLFAGIPFMNGGLFECLDKTLGTAEKHRYVRLDGFSDRDDNPRCLPNDLFFGAVRTVDLSDAYGHNKFKAAKVAGLISILEGYNSRFADFKSEFFRFGLSIEPLVNRRRESEQVQNTGLHCVEFIVPTLLRGNAAPGAPAPITSLSVQDVPTQERGNDKSAPLKHA